MTETAETVLVTGAAGFLGREVMRRLRQEGHLVIGLDLREDTDNSIRVCDVSRADQLAAVLGDTDIGAIVHCGAVSGPMLYRDQPAFVAGTNIAGTLNLLEVARLRRIRRFVFCSSGSVYGPRDPASPVPEDVPLHPTSPYAASKVAGEALVEAYRATHDLGGVSLRIAAVYGPGRQTACHIRDMLCAARDGRMLTIPYGADQHFHYIRVEDVANAVLASLAATVLPRRAYTIAGDAMTLGEIAGIVRRHHPLANIEIGAAIDPLSDVHGPYVLDAATTDLGWRPSMDIEEGICRYGKWLALNDQEL